MSETIKCLIIDDEALAQKVIENYIADLPDLQIAGKCNSALEAMSFLNQQDIDLIFLDINMPKLSGLNFLRSLKNPPLVIITTAYREYALEGYELDVVDYLHKPFSFERFIMAINKVNDRVSKKKSNVSYILEDETRMKIEESFIFIRSDKITHKINLKDILFIEAVGDYIKIMTTEKAILSYQTMKKMEEILSPKHFTRIHKSYIIAISKINSIDGNQVVIGDQKIPVGRSYRQGFNEMIRTFS